MLCKDTAERYWALKKLYVYHAIVGMVLDFGGIRHLFVHFVISAPYRQTLKLEADSMRLQLMVDVGMDMH